MKEITYRVLGPLRVEKGGQPIELRRERPRSLLAALLLRAGETVTAAQLIGDLWGPAPPASADQLIRAYVSRLRFELGADAVVTRPGGYAIAVEREAVDASRFAQLVDEGDAHAAGGNAIAAVAAYRSALALWDGQVAAGTPLEAGAAALVRQLDERRLHALEARFELDLASGEIAGIIPELTQAVADHPAREGMVAQLMLALYRSGRQADALEAFQATRRYLSEELGLEPSPSLQTLQRLILRHDPSLDLPISTRGRQGFRHRRTTAAASAVLLVGLSAVAVLATVSVGGTARARSESVVRLDGSTGRVEASTPVNGTPGAVVIAGPNLWVVDLDHQVIDELDATTLKRRASLGLTAIPHQLAYDGHTVWLADGFVGTLSRIGPDATVTPSFRPESRSKGRLALAYGDGTLWVGSQDGAVSRLAPPTATTLAVIRGLEAPETIATGFRSGWVTQATSVDLIRIEASTNQVARRIPLGGIATTVAITKDAVWALTPETGRLWRINPHTNAVTASIPVPAGTSTLAATSSALWLISQASGTLNRIDEDTDELDPSIRIGYPLAAVASDGRDLYVTTTTTS